MEMNFSKEIIWLNNMLSRVIISTIKDVSKLLAIHIALIWEISSELNKGEKKPMKEL